MADREISELTAADTLDGTELVHVDQDGNSRKATLQDIAGLSTGAMLVATYDPDTNGIIAVAQGGTNASTASGARTNLGLGTMAVQGAGAVAITGGSVTGITDLTVADGGTGASDADGARTNLGLAIGTDVQAYSANLAGFAATTVANVQNRDNHTGTQLAETISDFSTAADLRIAAAVGVSVQAYDALLASVAALTVSAGDVIYATGADTVAALPAGASGQVLAIDGDGNPAWDTSLVVGGLIAANNLSDVANSSTALTNLGVSTFAKTILDDATADAALTTLGFGAAGKAIAADAVEGDVRNYLLTAPFCADRAALRALNTTKDTKALFDGDQWTWVGTSFASTLRTIVGTTSVSGNVLTDTAHGLETGVAILCNATLNGVTANTLVYAIVLTADTYSLATTYANAIAGTVITLTGTSAMTMYRHNDPAQGVIVTKTGDITGAQGGWTRDNYATREWEWRWFGIVDSTSTTGADQAQAINAWMAAANAFTPGLTKTGKGFFAIDSRIHSPTHILGLHGYRAGNRPSAIYRRFSEPNGPSIASSAVNSGTGTVTSVGHGLVTGDTVIVTAAVNGLSLNTLYYVIRVDADNYRLSAKKSGAHAGTVLTLTGTTAMTVQKPSARGNLALTTHGGDIRYITFQAKTDGSIMGGSGLSCILPTDALRIGDLFIQENYIAPGLGANFTFVLDGSANISSDPSGIGSNGQRDSRIRGNILFASNICAAYLYSPFGLDWDNSVKGNISGGGDSPALILTGQPNNRATLCNIKNDVHWTDVLLDYVEDSTISGRKSGKLVNSPEVKSFNWIGDNTGGTTENFWDADSGFSFDRRSGHFLVGPTSETSSEASIGNVIRNDGLSLSKVSGTGTNAHVIFYNDALGTPTEIGRISSNGSTTTYATSSDMWRKDDRGEMSAELAIQILRLMKFHEFDWIVNGQRDYGVFAQELHEVYPAAVPVQGGWELDEDGNAQYVPWMVDYSKLIPVLGRAMQSFDARLQALEAR